MYMYMCTYCFNIYLIIMLKYAKKNFFLCKNYVKSSHTIFCSSLNSHNFIIKYASEIKNEQQHKNDI